MKVNDRYWAGRMLFFLDHTPPGVHVDCEFTVFIADGKWYNHVPQRQAMSPALSCPIFKASYKDDISENMWPVQKLAPCKFAAVYHRQQQDRIVILSRFSSFLSSVP